MFEGTANRTGNRPVRFLYIKREARGGSLARGVIKQEVGDARMRMPTAQGKG